MSTGRSVALAASLSLCAACGAGQSSNRDPDRLSADATVSTDERGRLSVRATVAEDDGGRAIRLTDGDRLVAERDGLGGTLYRRDVPLVYERDLGPLDAAPAFVRVAFERGAYRTVGADGRAPGVTVPRVLQFELDAAGTVVAADASIALAWTLAEPSGAAGDPRLDPEELEQRLVAEPSTCRDANGTPVRPSADAGVSRRTFTVPDDARSLVIDPDARADATASAVAARCVWRVRLETARTVRARPSGFGEMRLRATSLSEWREVTLESAVTGGRP